MIREMNHEDIDTLIDIWLESTAEAHSFIPKSYWTENYVLIKEHYLPTSKTYVFEDVHLIKGFISILNNNYIGALFIDTKHQNNGIGSKLISHVQKHYNQLSLSVYKKNVKATNFYKNMNFYIEEENLDTATNEFEYLMFWNSFKQI
ncbi:N-acetyltransferase [Clostridium manihotivorum]|uniref:N-acetyltransferase n=1 Tax=Clostridium manihotivorum TaxID=2320868 RepID=A0A410DWP7_9CLOT|nr:N-acetyltransferase [Clostridium manihotivorum]QAA33352.1 N-acetyltransferase [Clostridium manihotivorum]